MKRGKDYIGVGIGAVIINEAGKVFLSKRGKNAQNERGLWECPGGALEYGESFEESVIREIKEEFDFEVEPLTQLEPFNHLIPDEGQHWVALAFICRIKSGTPKIMEQDKSEAIGWFTFAEMEKLALAEPSKMRLQQMKQTYKKALPNLYIA